MSLEMRRYDTIRNFRVAAVEEAYFIRPEKLYRPPAPPRVIQYVRDSLPQGKYASVDAALVAVRLAFNGR